MSLFHCIMTCYQTIVFLYHCVIVWHDSLIVQWHDSLITHWHNGTKTQFLNSWIRHCILQCINLMPTYTCHEDLDVILIKWRTCYFPVLKIINISIRFIYRFFYSLPKCAAVQARQLPTITSILLFRVIILWSCIP